MPDGLQPHPQKKQRRNCMLSGSSVSGWLSSSGSFDCVNRNGAIHFAQDDELWWRCGWGFAIH